MPSEEQSKRTDLVIRSDMPAWVIKVLRANGIKRIARLHEMTDAELLKLPGVGPRVVEIVRSSIAHAPSAMSHRTIRRP